MSGILCIFFLSPNTAFYLMVARIMTRLVAVKMERKERLGCIFSQQNLPMGCFDLSSEKKVWALSNCMDGGVIF